MADFINKAKAKIQDFAREGGYFVSSRLFWVNIGKMAGLVGLTLFVIFWGLKCYTRHGDVTKVGSYVNKNIKEAMRLAEDDGFDIVVTDSIYRDGFPADIVIEQNPLPGTLVKEGRTIYIKITKAQGDLVTLPDLPGRDEINAYIFNLQEIGIKVGRVDTVPDGSLSDGTIIEVKFRGQNIRNSLATGFKVPQGAVIDFVIAKKEVPPIVPDFANRTADEYTFEIEALGLQVGDVIKDPSVTNQNTARVYRVEPVVGTQLFKGATVTIYLTQKDKGPTRPDDSFDQ